MKRIDLNQALLAWHFHVGKVNATQPIIERTRIKKNVTTNEKYAEIYFVQPKLITGNVEATGERVIKEYVKIYEKVLESKILVENLQKSGKLPSLATNCLDLGQKRTVSDRTMRSHLKKLRHPAVGLISNYTFHGTRANFELWINPLFLFPEPSQLPPSKWLKTPVSPSEPTNFPVTLTLERSNTGEIEISDVHISGVAEPQCALPAGEGAGNHFTGNPGPPSKEQTGSSSDIAANSSQEQTAAGRGAQKPEKKALNPIYLGFVESFFLYAWKVLYPTYSFSDFEQRETKNAIFIGVFNRFRVNWTPEQWANYYENLIQRLDLAAAYYYRHRQEKKPPLPYAQFVPGAGYFDRENERGFRNTLNWLAAHNQRQREYLIDRALRRARKEIRENIAGTGNKRVQSKSPLELYRFHETQIRKLGSEPLKRFYAQHSSFEKIHVISS